MGKGKKTEGMLESYRVLDLTDERTYLCGKILADMGADVIKVERPDGDAGRRLGPFYHDTPDPEKSLYWFAYNNNKEGITLNIETADGMGILKKLVERADIIIESFEPSHRLKGLLSYEELSKINKGIVATSITPFGLTGPYKDYKASDLVGMGMGNLFLTGDPDRAPVFASFPQAYSHAAAQAAAATMVALWHREVSGEGQQVDVSMQQSVCLTTVNAIPFWHLHHQILSREGPLRKGLAAKVTMHQTWQCKDGFVAFAVFGGTAGAPTNRALAEWMDSEGMSNDFLKQMDWEAIDMATVDQDFWDRIEVPIGEFFMTHTKAELYEQAIKRRIMLLPVSSIKDIAEDAQLRARGFWQEVEYPELGDMITSPGPFINILGSYCGVRHRAPLIGEHNSEVYQEIGISREELIILKQGRII